MYRRKMGTEKKLTLKQQRFCEYYAGSGNAAQAAIKAGYSEKTAKTIGQQNLTKLDLQEYLKELTAKADEKRILSAAERQEILSKMAEDKNERTDSRIKAIDTLNKMTGEYIAKVDVTGRMAVENPFDGVTRSEIKKLLASCEDDDEDDDEDE